MTSRMQKCQIVAIRSRHFIPGRPLVDSLQRARIVTGEQLEARFARHPRTRPGPEVGGNRIEPFGEIEMSTPEVVRSCLISVVSYGDFVLGRRGRKTGVTVDGLCRRFLPTFVQQKLRQLHVWFPG